MRRENIPHVDLRFHWAVERLFHATDRYVQDGYFHAPKKYFEVVIWLCDEIVKTNLITVSVETRRQIEDIRQRAEVYPNQGVIKE